MSPPPRAESRHAPVFVRLLLAGPIVVGVVVVAVTGAGALGCRVHAGSREPAVRYVVPDPVEMAEARHRIAQYDEGHELEVGAE